MQEEKVQRLSEGYDFIEENTAFCNEPLSYQDINETVIVESTGGKTSPYKILGKISGVFAPIGEFSRNRRLYSENLWPTVLANEEFQSRLKGRRIFSCLGHEDKKIDDFDLKEGKVSGVVSCLEVKDDVNGKPFLYGEIDILDTPAGRILKAMHEGGAGLYVSSRGAGKLVPVPGQDYSLVTPDSYYCHCFDTVLNPGFLKAKPMFEQVKESSNEEVNEAEEVSSEIEATDESLTTAATLGALQYADKKVAGGKGIKGLQNKLAKAVEKKIKENNEPANEEIQTLKSQIEQLTGIIERVVDSLYETEKSDIQETLEGFAELMANTNISEDLFKELVEQIKKGV